MPSPRNEDSYENSSGNNRLRITELPEDRREDDAGNASGSTYFVDDRGSYYIQHEQNVDHMDQDQIQAGKAVQEVDPFASVNQGASQGNQNVSFVVVMGEEVQEPGIGASIKEEPLTMDENFEGKDHYVDGQPVQYKPAPVKKKRKKKKKPAITKCTFCSYTNPQRYLLKRHMMTHSEERPHSCDVCGRSFKTLAALQNHTNMHNGIKPHVCKCCGASFTTSGELVRHVRYKHTHEKPHKCTQCDYASVELSKLRRHVLCHTGERPFQCAECPYAAADAFKLQRHMRIHNKPKPHKCETCGMAFVEASTLKYHVMIHKAPPKQVFTCELCPVKCARKPDLKNHVLKQHTSDVPLKCKRCDLTFPDRYSRKLHSKTHKGDKCYKCELCPFATATARALKSHILKHKNEKPFACEECERTFRQKQLLRRHQNIHHNPDYKPKPPKAKAYTCTKCKRGFAHKGNLDRHMAVHAQKKEGEKKAKAKNAKHDEASMSSSDGKPMEMVSMNGEEMEQDEREYMVLGSENVSDVIQDNAVASNPSNWQEQKSSMGQMQKKEMKPCFGFDEQGDDTADVMYGLV